jgi:hypothetical protein
MRESTITALLRGALCAGLASCPLLAADLASPGSGDGDFWTLVLGMMVTIFGGMAFCFGLVKLAEKLVHSFQVKRVAPVSAPEIRHAAKVIADAR